MKLIACSNCHTQYDVADMAPDAKFDCRCGATLEAKVHKGADAPVQRCSSCGALANEADEQCGYCGAEVVHLEDRGSLICPECFARNADDARFCLACGIGFEPEAVQGQRSELECPVCERNMSTRIVAGVEVQECGKCHGLWAPEMRFEALVDRAIAAAREQSIEGMKPKPRVDGANPASNQVVYRRCPECDALMGRQNFRKRSGVVIDRCSHGTWLDAHELEQIAGFVLSGRAEKADRMVAAERDALERAQADMAMRRAMAPAEFGGAFSTSSRESRSSEWNAAETIFDLLTSLIFR